MSDKLAALSVDLDETECYAAIHGLGQPPAEAAHAIYDHALGRFERWFEQLGVRATFFVIGRDLERTANAETIARLHRAGHEIGNHTKSHLYDLTRRSKHVIEEEVLGGAQLIEQVTGAKPPGFRAPGYTVNDTLLSTLWELGVRYDSSVFPAPAYYAAKLAAIGALRLRGERSHSVADTPMVLRCPADPYRVGRPYWQRGSGLLELPIGVTREPSGRLPYIGTSLTLGGPRVSALMTRAIVGRPLVNLELHGIDLADAGTDGLGFLRPHQPDLRRPLAHKRASLERAVETLRDAGYRFVTLGEAACRFG